MVAIHELARRAAAGTISVLLLGETGAGKEVLADVVHRHSRRAGAFLRINCAAFTESLLESELFGHERGAFSGAHQTKPGLLETADGGSVFLDEIGEMPLGLQAKLLRVIEERRVTRVGAVKPRDLDVRFIAATNRDLEVEVDAGRFRRDLLYRLNGVTLTIPPLRQRPSEIAELARRFLARTAARHGRPAPRLSHDAVRVLCEHRWPGNIRELVNVIERAVIVCGAGDEIRPEHLAPSKRAAGNEAVELAPAIAASSVAPLFEPVDAAAERERIVRALEHCAGNQTHAARLLGVSRGTLIARLKQHNIPRPRSQRV
jgi:two-component system response regulator AtoC